MRWAPICHGRVLCIGTRAEVLAAGERAGVVVREFHAEGFERPPGIARDVVMMPERMLPARLRRRAA